MKTLVFICWILYILWDSEADMPFLIDTDDCKVPKYNITYTDIPTGPACGKRRIFIRKIGDDLIRFEMRKRFSVCCYQDIEVALVKLKQPCIPFINNTEINVQHGLIKIKCYPNYKDYFVLVKNRSRERIWPAYRANYTWNFLLLGMEGMSRSRAYSSLPLTTQLLNANYWLDFSGYSTVGKNEDTNSAILLGSRSNWVALEPKCKVDMSLCNHMLIWHEFARTGHVTAFGEDAAPAHNLFHHWHIRQPTDHYFRPKIIKDKNELKEILCDGQISTAEQMLNYIVDFTKTYNKKHKFFGYFRLSSYRHDLGASPRAIDKPLSIFLNKLKHLGVWKNTIIILFSDSGFEFVPARRGMNYFYDERLPMLFIGIPRSFTEMYPEKHLNIVSKQHRLVSPFDLHLTLWDILKMGHDFLELPDILGCSQCHSLFKKIITEYRTCSDAGIDDTWCLCPRLGIAKFL